MSERRAVYYFENEPDASKRRRVCLKPECRIVAKLDGLWMMPSSGWNAFIHCYVCKEKIEPKINKKSA